MPNNRGTVRRSKLKDPSLRDLSSKKVDALEHQAVTYLERELNILTSTPGNFSEVSRILKILKDHKTQEPKGDSLRSKSSEPARTWSLED